MLIRLIAKLTRGKFVYLQDMNGRVYKSIAYINPFGNTWCYVYPIARIGHVILLSDGEVDPHSGSSYIKNWIAG